MTARNTHRTAELTAAIELIKLWGHRCPAQLAALGDQWRYIRPALVDPAAAVKVWDLAVQVVPAPCPTQSAARWWNIRSAPSEPTAAGVMAPLAMVRGLTASTTVSAALEQVLQSSGPALPVFDETRVAGVVTLADLARRIHDSHGLPRIERVETVMRPPTILESGAPISAVRAKIADEPSGLVLVAAPSGEPVGYITAETLLIPGPGHDGATGEPGTSLLLPRPGALLP